MRRKRAGAARARWLPVALLGLACSGPAPAREDANAPATVAPDAAAAAGDEAAAGPRLGSGHAGWKRATCFDCHDPAALAAPHLGVAYAPPECVSCHGPNGAPHADHAADPAGQCAECHRTGAIVSDHLDLFALPQACATCHVHPQNPEGR